MRELRGDSPTHNPGVALEVIESSSSNAGPVSLANESSLSNVGPVSLEIKAAWTRVGLTERDLSTMRRRTSPDTVPPKAEMSSLFAAEAAGPKVGQAACDALAQVVAAPLTGAVVAGVRPLDGGSADIAAQGQIDGLSEALQAVVDPGRIPSAVIQKAVTHLLTPLAAAALGPVGAVVAIFVGNVAGDLTDQVLNTGRDIAAERLAENSIELGGALDDARIGRLAESQPFTEYVGGLLAQPIAAIISEAATPHGERHRTMRAPAACVVVAAYEVDTPGDRSSSTLSDEPPAARIRLVSSAVMYCIPESAVLGRGRASKYQYLRLSNGTIVRRRLDDGRPGPWTRMTG
jgi:hypothetical protein